MNIRAGSFGGTALHAAFWRGHPDIARFLLESGINPNIKDLNGVEASEFAHFHGDPTFVELAFDYARKKPKTEIPENLTSAVSQAYSAQRMASAASQVRSKPISGRFMNAGHRQYWKSPEPKKPKGAEDQIFELG
jgi:ankyrin repeat protein